MSSERQQLHELRVAVLAMARGLGAALPATREIISSLDTLCATTESPYAGKTLVLTESVMTHMLADLDQIVTEMHMDFGQRSLADWLSMLRHAVDGEDYKI